MKKFLVYYIKQYILTFNIWGILLFPILIPATLLVVLWIKVENWAQKEELANKKE